MESVFTLPYSEYCVAVHLQDLFKPKDGFSLFVPMSRQEKGVDLLLTKRLATHSVCMTIQVKASRTYSPKPSKSENDNRLRYYTWFNTFDVPKEADYIFLVGLYPPEDGRTNKRAASWWSAVILAFSHADMTKFMKGIKTRKGTRDPMFGFGFDEPTKIFQTRGDTNRNFMDYSNHLLRNQVKTIKARFEIK